MMIDSQPACDVCKQLFKRGDSCVTNGKGMVAHAKCANFTVPQVEIDDMVAVALDPKTPDDVRSALMANATIAEAVEVRRLKDGVRFDVKGGD